MTQSFTGVFEELQSLGRQDAFALELLACLLFRAAFMLDHYYDDELNVWRYFPAENIINSIESKTKKIHGMPLSVYLRYLDAIALNEDVKYSTLGYDITKGTGRQNNLLTCVNIIGVFLNKVSIAKFAGNFARPPVGIAAISTKMAKEIFPLLNTELPLPLF